MATAVDDPFRSLFANNVISTDDNRYFLPLSRSNVGQSQMLTPQGHEGGGYFQQNNDDSQTFIRDDTPRPYYGIGDEKYYSLEDYYKALDPSQVGIIGPGRQNAIGFPTAQRGDYNGELGYFVDPNSVVGLHPAITSGIRPNESGVSQFLLSAALAWAGGELFGGAASGVADAATNIPAQAVGNAAGSAASEAAASNVVSKTVETGITLKDVANVLSIAGTVYNIANRNGTKAQASSGASGSGNAATNTPPAITPPATMPVSGPNSTLVRSAQRASIQQQSARRGRASTILTSDPGERLGA